MEVVDVLDGFRVQELLVDQVTGVGSHGEVLPAVMVGVYWVLLAENDVLDTDSELTVLVVAWLVGHAHAFQKFHFACSADALWSFMNVEVSAHTMASAMLEVKAYRPKAATRQDIHVCSCNRTV